MEIIIFCGYSVISKVFVNEFGICFEESYVDRPEFLGLPMTFSYCYSLDPLLYGRALLTAHTSR